MPTGFLDNVQARGQRTPSLLALLGKENWRRHAWLLVPGALVLVLWNYVAYLLTVLVLSCLVYVVCLLMHTSRVFGHV